MKRLRSFWTWAATLALTLSLLPPVPARAAGLTVPDQKEAACISYDRAALVNGNGELWVYFADVTFGNDGIATADTKLSHSVHLADGIQQISAYDGDLYALTANGKLLVYDLTYAGDILGPVELLPDVVDLSPGIGQMALTTDGKLYFIERTGYYSHVGQLLASDYEVRKVDEGVDCLALDGRYLARGNVYYVTSGGLGFKLSKELSFSGAARLWYHAGNNFPSGAYFVLTENGDLYSWGQNQTGILGNGGLYDSYDPIVYIGDDEPRNTWAPLNINYSIPTKVLSGVTDLWPAEDAVYAIMEDGSLYTWGGGEKFEVYLDDNMHFIERKEPADMTPYSPRKVQNARWIYKPEGYPSYYIAEFQTDGTFWFEAGYKHMLQAGRWTSSTSTIPPAPTVGGFSDVREGDYYTESVLWAVEEGITTGTGVTTFSPDATCTRAQIITFLWRAAGAPQPKNPVNFTDVPADAYYANAAAWAWENGMADGDRFYPDDPCSRLMAVEFIWNQAGSPQAPLAGFTDVSSGSVNWAVEAGVTTGTTTTTFSPDSICTRGQIVTFLYRAFAK